MMIIAMQSRRKISEKIHEVEFKIVDIRLNEYRIESTGTVIYDSRILA